MFTHFLARSAGNFLKSSSTVSVISNSGNALCGRGIVNSTTLLGLGVRIPTCNGTRIAQGRFFSSSLSPFETWQARTLKQLQALKLLRARLCKKLSKLPSRLPKASPLLCAAAVPGLCVAAEQFRIFPLDLSKLFVTAQCKAKQRPTSRLLDDDDSNNDSKKTDPQFQWRLFFQLLWQDIFYLLGAVVAAVGAAMVNIQIPLMLGELTNIVSKYTSAMTTEVADFLSDIRGPAIKLMGIYGLQGLLTFTYIGLLSVVGENMAARLRKQLFHSLLCQDIDFFDTHKTGELVDRLTSDVQDFKSSFKLTISQGLRAVTQTVGCVASLFMISTKLTFVMLGVIPVVIIGGTLLGAALRTLSRDAQEQIARSTAVADEALGNVRTVRAFAMEKKEFELYEEQVNKSSALNIRLGVGIGAFQGAANMFLNGIVLGSLFAGGWLISMHELQAGDLISFLVATQMIERSMAQMSLLFGHMIRGTSAGARVFEYIDLQPKIPLDGGRSIPFHALMGDIEFSSVGFHYPSRPGQEILTNFNLKVRGGQMVALVGLSGGGKSTLAVLLERFYDVTSGKITLDGVDLRDFDPTWLRGHAIGFINQEPVLFATSVMENIRYGKPEATDQEVIEAARLANADTFIRKFPKGYSTVLGERGVTVSGGQKQRIAIARALIKNPSILILDEATSALDAESERLVQEALDKVVKGRTTLVIAHRLSTIRDADVIAVVSKGRIMEMGTHSELKSKRGLYWELIKKQELEEDLEKN
ncbi:mitochondrial potassium channel ATP-binding subunit isoform X1 [Aplysia californica]|uniref:Mitochondrial potassium channel ATP-binding subunit n=1 Tax=Aplysia californica TaxID=6500 RepID=A0ABM0K3X1_APLCA|nr:mitochondrial potassium channel ATP-binding subunit isoform X1 [Aplysia californica]